MSKKDPEFAILEYLQQQNRPYSATDIFNNMHKEIGKTAVVKALDSLASKSQILEKTYGKQKVYAPLQDIYGDVSEAELKAMDVKIKEKQGSVAVLQKELKTQEAEINALSKQLTVDEVRERISQLSEQNGAVLKKLNELKNGRVLVTKEERTKIYARRDKFITFWKKRKRMANDILGCILESYPKKKKDLYEDVGIETDEDVDVKMPVVK